MINHKDKAKEIYNTYYGKILILDSVLAKYCSILAVQEIIAALIEYGKKANELQNMDRELAYWDKVIEEINLL